jgi:hypothetical protein
MACHCPELLLTSAESARARSSINSNDELPLLFATLLKLVRSGGERSASHLINRMGLLSWLRSFLLGHPTLTKLSSRIAFLELLNEVVRISADSLPGDEFTGATGGLAQSALSLGLECIGGSHATKGRYVARKLPDSMITCICQLLATLTRAKSASDLSNRSQNTSIYQPDGVHLESAIQFISILQSQEHLRLALSICQLPARCRSGESSLLESFCRLVLETSMNVEDCNSELKLAVLQRVALLLAFIDPSSIDTKPILEKLLAWRSECAREQRPREAWHTCLKALVTRKNDVSSNTSLSAAGNEFELACWVLKSDKHSTGTTSGI